MATGETTSKPELALRQAVFQLEKRSELIELLRAKLTKPAMITLAAIGAYAYIGYSLVPQLLALMPVEKWTGPTRDMIDAGLFVKNNMAWIALGLVALISVTVYALPNLKGLIRDKLDRIPPFSVYKAFQGGVFILNLSSSGSAGLGPEDALNSMRETATPYLKERIDDTLRGIRRGLNIGRALENAEHDFPDRESIAFIRTLAGKPGFNSALESSVPSLLKEAINRISSAASFLNILAMALAAHAVGTLLLGSFGIDQAAKAMH